MQQGGHRICEKLHLVIAGHQNCLSIHDEPSGREFNEPVMRFDESDGPMDFSHASQSTVQATGSGS